MEKTMKMYYESAYKRNFAAVVLACGKAEGGWKILLDGTCFYPGGGGQPCDIGTLGGVRVVECYSREGLIWHIVEGDVLPFAVGGEVRGQVDFARRFAFMQNHTGEHLLSGLAKSRWGATNVGFHMSMSERGFTMDLDVALDADAVEEMERLANEAVMAAVDVDISGVAGSGLGGLDVRAKREFADDDEVRLVSIEGYDLCACAGLHTANTLEVGVVKVVSTQKYKGGVRLTVFCGRDAAWDYGRKHDIVREISRLASAETDKCVGAVEKLLSGGAALKKEIGGLKNRIFEMRAAQVALDSGFAWFCEDGLDADDMRRFADMVVARAKMAVVLSKSGDVWRYYACGRDDAESLQDFVGRLNTELGGKGGGKGLAAQGALQADFTMIEEFLRNEYNAEKI
ncbi:MAG: alanyl-tRNA editing protein [Defluviitaleaceae bacterium]|nr:alanyl-tRNA editing protein [Defluviitaleaceae bacterium]